MNSEPLNLPLSSVSEALRFQDVPEVSYAAGERPGCLFTRSRGSEARPLTLLRSKLLKKLQEEKANIIGLTSATPDVGKSFLSIALSSSLARVTEKPVVLVDLDLRRASVAEYLKLEVGKGVGDYLADPSLSLQDIAVRIAQTNLFVLPTRAIGSESAELLAGPRFEEFMASLRSLGPDVTCVVDLPPAFANDDAMIALEKLDGYVLVAEYAKTTKRHILDTLSMLAPAPCLGSILNRYEGGFGDTYAYGSSTYSRYYE
ncbi:CpsD/CapB family tyrosine-protein kinase [Qipengyuania vesicularis]|uniref:CpsD/CapB family tyrosine-protein kinase n=1 Tax=Qipengyuania vesicularis TaxID=2867232 RepID=UPI001C8791B3|nr:CpsD/CapB family tyrosine-protein kinase [Qipengyuania vesicularis]MBX7527889.1 CpsD/CapB family tyrosine-protein kinase [Qipengyuania vesicularis]